MRQGKPQDDSLAMWLLLGMTCSALLFGLLWLVASHMIVYYLTPVMHALAMPWRWWPTEHARQLVVDLDFNYVLFRRHAAFVSLNDWLSYVNVCLRPWSYAFIVLAITLFFRQVRRTQRRRLNQKLTPKQLALQMMEVFSDIAPVVNLQEKLVSNKLSRWARQQFPEEFLRNLRFQKRSVFVPDESGEMALDTDRLRNALTQTRPYVHEGMQLRESPFLGRQLVDITKDAGSKNNALFVERLSPAGQAVFALLAPYAFGSAKGKAESKRVKDALNYSAFGSPQGIANLSVPEAGSAFETWKNHPLARKLAKIHQWEYTFLMALLEHAQRSGKIGTWNFIWLKPTNRILFYALNTVGRKTPHSESGLAFSQYQYETRVARRGRLPLNKDGSLVIFTPRLVDALHEEWVFWRNGDEDTDNWWQEEGLLDWDKNETFINAMRELNAAPPVPSDVQ